MQYAVSRYPKPPQPYFYTLGLIALDKLWWLAQQAFPTALPDLWTAIPWIDLTIWGALVTLGLLIADFQNRGSWLRMWLRELTAIASISSIHTNHTEIDDVEWVRINAHLIIVRNIRSGSLVVRVSPKTRNRTWEVSYKKDLDGFQAGQKINFPLGHLRIARPHKPAAHSIWGDSPGTTELTPEQVTIVPGNEYLVEIEIKSGRRTQRTRFIADILRAEHEDKKRVYILREEEDKFAA